ncbi:thiamine pyrophosphate-binding protein [Dankookia sp. P2]|uniref:thiamine pyrophosphate-binding protein n=1 Tax=Dankookia sp. P2 TaxID=3423955 RepID=UPI003D671381
MADTVTVRQATMALLRDCGMTTVFGNPGSTELGFLDRWPNDFRYVLGLQEASVVAMADGYARASGRAAFCNLHSAAGLGHALGNVFTAHRNQAPLVITAGQQSRSLLPHNPFLGATDAASFAKPYVKWSREAGPGRGCAGRDRTRLSRRPAAALRPHFRVHPKRRLVRSDPPPPPTPNQPGHGARPGDAGGMRRGTGGGA